MAYLEIAAAQLRIDEGSRLRLYPDQFGNETIGIGRNLKAVGISEDEQELMFANDLNHAVVAASTIFSNFSALTDNRKAALVNMAFNLGQERLEEFHTLIALVTSEAWGAAADDMLKTAWATQVGARAERLADQMRNG